MLNLVSALLTLTAGPATPPPNTIVPPMFYSEIVNTAQQIVAGTVTGSKCRYERGKETIATLVTFSGLTVYKGKVGKTITIRLEGGKMGDDNLRVPLMPKFKIGAKYLVYVDGLGGKKVSPIVGFHQGAFQVVIKNGKEVLLNTGGEELIGIQKDRFVFAAKPSRRSLYWIYRLWPMRTQSTLWVSSATWPTQSSHWIYWTLCLQTHIRFLLRTQHLEGL